MTVNDEGVLIVIFYDQRFDHPAYYTFDLFASYSFDAGKTFTANRRITTLSSSPSNLKTPTTPAYTLTEDSIVIPTRTAARAGLLGEYIGVTSFHDKINAVWTDTRDGNSECYTANWYLSIMEPRLYAPAADIYLTEQPVFQWATSWKNDQDRYRLEICQDEQFGSGIIARVLDTNFYAIDSALSEGTYYWRVKTMTTTGVDSSDYSEIRRFDLDLYPPDAPILLAPANGTQTGNPTPFFDWTTVAKSPVTYDLIISNSSTFPFSTKTQFNVGLTASEFQITRPLIADTTSYWKVVARDGAGQTDTSEVFTIAYRRFECGDVNNDSSVDVSDLTYFVAYAFKDGPPPPIEISADVDASGDLNIADVTRWVDFSFKNGPPLNCL
jgi:hypothetical protein